MTNKTIEEFENPRNSLFAFGLLISLFLLLFFIFIVSTDGFSFLILILTFPSILFILIASFYGGVYNYPYRVQIDNEGVLLYYKLKKSKKIIWDEIKSTYSSDHPSNTVKGGSITLKGSISPILLKSEIVKGIRARYYQNTGQYLNENDRAYR